MRCFKVVKKHISFWQIISFLFIETMIMSTIILLIMQSVDIVIGLFHNGDFMFSFLDMYSNLGSFMVFDFSVMVISMIPECIGFNIIITVINVLLCVVMSYFSLHIFKPKAKTVLIIWLAILLVEIALSFVFMLSDIFFLLVIVCRAVLLFFVIKSLGHINRNYEYYDI